MLSYHFIHSVDVLVSYLECGISIPESKETLSGLSSKHTSNEMSAIFAFRILWEIQKIKQTTDEIGRTFVDLKNYNHLLRSNFLRSSVA